MVWRGSDLGILSKGPDEVLRKEAATSPFYLKAEKVTRRGLEAGDEVAEVTSLRVGGGLLGQERERGLRG